MKKALIYLEEQQEELAAQLAEVICRLYPEKQVTLWGICFGKEAPGQGIVDELHLYRAEKEQSYHIRWMAEQMEQLHRRENFDCIVMPATFRGRMLAPVLAAKLQTGLVADVVEVFSKEEEIHMVRPAFDGKLMAEIVVKQPGVVMMSVRPGVFPGGQHLGKKTHTVFHEVQGQPASIRLVEHRKKPPVTDIRDAKVLVSGGGGVMEQFSKLQKLAEPLHAMVSSSRRLVDSGITQRSIQVGQSGKTVSPKLYIALGIYGSLQHMEGLRDVEDIISVNTNRYAPICSVSSLVVEGDAIEFIEKLTTKIQQEKEQTL